MRPDDYKQAIVDSGAADIVYTDLFTGVHGNYLRASIVNAGLDPDNLAASDPTAMKFGSEGSGKVEGVARHLGLGPGHRRRSTGCGRPPTMIDLLAEQYAAAKARLCGG